MLANKSTYLRIWFERSSFGLLIPQTASSHLDVFFFQFGKRFDIVFLLFSFCVQRQPRYPPPLNHPALHTIVQPQPATLGPLPLQSLPQWPPVLLLLKDIPTTASRPTPTPSAPPNMATPTRSSTGPAPTPCAKCPSSPGEIGASARLRSALVGKLPFVHGGTQRSGFL